MNEYHSPRFVSRITQETLALVLAGGRGARLKQLTSWRTKPAVSFGGKFRIIDFALSNCVNSGVRRIAVLTQYKSHSLIRHLQRGWGFLRAELGEFVDIFPASQRLENNWYQGTADAVYQNLDIIRGFDSKYTVILAGDHIYKMDYGPMLAFHVENKADMTIACMEVPVDEARAFGVMGVNEAHRITSFAEKPDNPALVPGKTDVSLASMGIYVFNTDFLYEQLIKDADMPRSSRDFGKDIIPSVIDKYQIMAYPFQGVRPGRPSYWRDVGTVDAFWEANMELVSIHPILNLYDTEWPIWTYQRQLPPAKFIFDEDGGRRGTAVDSMVSGGCLVSGAKICRSLLSSQVEVHSYSALTDTVVLPEVSIGSRCRISKAVIDRGCVIPTGTVIGEDAEEDAARFYRTESGIVLVTPEMLGQEIHFVR